MLKHGDKVGIVACSNALKLQDKSKIIELLQTLKELGLDPIMSEYIYATNSVFSASGKERAAVLNKFYKDVEIKAIFDISGGDIANELLNFMDFDAIKKLPKPFFGYSDLTTILNAIYAKTEITSYLYQIKCLVSENKQSQIADFNNSILNNQDDLYRIKWNWISGSKVEGTVIGGNIRCFLKLAGTQYMPDFHNKILFLESYSGDTAKMTTYLCQLNQMGVFQKISGLLLGTFTEMDKDKTSPSIVDLVLNITDNMNFPIARTHNVGHGSTSKCLKIGEKLYMVKT